MNYASIGVIWIDMKPLTSLTILLGLALSSCTPVAPDGMLPIPAGPFMMGTDQKDTQERSLEFGLTKAWFEDESPARSIYPFSISIDWK